ncbi:MAG: bifunctional phosphopantothenoylcysteine decarboxylase/phosphopantothenate--cysteine ligase CoaBC [Deltaproteobacteria bacterium]|nr:bifunctional phosphopantothenoylcysteine decarboxylase/phosphopantothenate--cysteine ligase CoaBC [Deltaproteobacteria bacterium]
MHFLLSAFRFLLTDFSLLPDMSKLTFLITAGPTQEPIDPVRYLSNRSSGKMGYALAKAARAAGHHVVLISGPTSLTSPSGIKFIPVTTALEMRRAVMKNFRSADVIVKVAAVADYRPSRMQNKKIKKTGKPMTLKLVPNPDILKELGRKKRKNQILVGFSAETDRGLPNAAEKLREKRCDWIVLNNVSKKGIGFGSDENEVTLLSKNGRILPLGRASKDKLAKRILEVILS